MTRLRKNTENKGAFLASLLPGDAGVRIEHIRVEPVTVVVELATTAAAVDCPECGQATTAVHARYVRRLHDRACLGHPLVLRVSVRKFRCASAACPRRVFCERLPGLTTPQARDTGPRQDAHRAIGLALGGEAGARLAKHLAVPTSADTLLRRVKATPAAPAPPPRFVGLDDWATRKGHTYCTILIDLERGTVIDLLPGRDGEALKAWLAANLRRPTLKGHHKCGRTWIRR